MCMLIISCKKSKKCKKMSMNADLHESLLDVNSSQPNSAINSNVLCESSYISPQVQKATTNSLIQSVLAGGTLISNNVAVRKLTFSSGSSRRASFLPPMRIPTKSKLFLLLVLLEVLILASERIWFDFFVLSGDLDSTWFFGLLIISTLFMILFAFDTVFNETYYSLFPFMSMQ